MELYKKDGITIATIQETDKEKILKYFSENTFNCDYETGSLRPSESQFIKIMDDIISGKDDEQSILVIKKDNEVIGYLSMHVEYSRLNLGHIAVKKSERGKGYGKLLTKIAILIAENDDRDINLYCAYPNGYLKKLGFTTHDNIHYMYKRRGIKTENIPKLFVTVEDYKNRMEEKQKKETESFRKFLESGILDILNGDKGNNRNMW